MNHQIPRNRRTRIFQIAVVFLLGAIAIAAWDVRPNIKSEAMAQIPDTALQRKQMIDEQRVTNELLTRILLHLETMPIKVRSVGSDERKDEAPKRPRPVLIQDGK